MNPATGNEILGYTGNVGLGLNADAASIGRYGDTDLRESNAALFNLAYLNMQKNRAVWQQKVSDRDEAMKLIASGKLQVNNALPKDRAKLMSMIDDVKKTFFDNNGDVKSDPKVWLHINDQLAKFNEANTTAQSRYLMGTQGMADAAKETNPTKKKKLIEHWSNQIENKDLFEPFDPYQQTLDWDNSKVFRKMTEKTNDLGTEGFNRITETRTDLQESYRDFVNAYQQGDSQEMGLNVDTFLDSFFGRDGILTPDSVAAKAQEVNDRLRKIAKNEGFNPDDVKSLPEYLRPMNPRVLNGQIQSNDYKWNDWYKIMLYDQYKVKKNTVYDKDLSAAAKIKSEIAENQAQAGANMMRARAYADAQKALGSKYRAQGKAIQEQTTPAQNYDELKTKTETVKTKNGLYITRVGWDGLQKNTQDYLGIDPVTGEDGKKFLNVYPTKVVVGDNEVADADVFKYYDQATAKGYKGSVIDYLNSVGAKFDIEVVGKEKGKPGAQRSGRQTSYQNQMDKKNKNSLFLESDNTPDEIPE